MGAMGSTLSKLGIMDEAIVVLEEALTLHERAGTLQTMSGGIALRHLGIVALKQEDAHRAAKLFTEALQSFEAVDMRKTPEGALTLTRLGEALTLCEKREYALQLF